MQSVGLELSIVIVNYNVRHFLEQCLHSVRKAIDGISAEIIVIDNHSTDNSVEYLESLFPEVRFTSNKENTGFAKACNQGLALSSGEHLLFLNPDTIVPEDAFTQAITFFKEHADCGALGVRMIDGSGRFLKESKRSFPEPLTSFYKLSGLARLFPRSRSFAKYHLGNLDEHKDHKVDVLAGAFMMVKRTVLEKTGGFDESFFMYGEDIDLSYRIQQAGFHNYYIAGITVIHFKGESTRKSSLNYVRMFYKAMSIFAKKHYGGGKAGVFNFFIQASIWARAVLSAIGGFIRRAGLPILDALLIMFSFWLIKNLWSNYVRPGVPYEARLLWIAIPSFGIFYLMVAYYAGLYDRWYRRSELVRSTLVATIVLLAGYSLLPEQYRFSRGIILFGALLAFLLIGLLRWLLVRTGVLMDRRQEKRTSLLIVGSPPEYEEALALVRESGMQDKILGRGATSTVDTEAIDYQAQAKLSSFARRSYDLVFCEGTLSFKEIIRLVNEMPGHTRIKIHAKHSHSIVGSQSKDNAGEALSKENGFRLADPYLRRLKRFQDVSVSMAGILLFPIHLFFVKHPFQFLWNCVQVIFGAKTWVGYQTKQQRLPSLRNAVLGCNGVPKSGVLQLPAESLQMLDYWYARDYRLADDLKIIRTCYRSLGAKE